MAVIWRSNPTKVQYTWLDSGWSAGEAHFAGQQLGNLVELLLHPSAILQYSIKMDGDLEDEHRAVS